MRVDLAAAYRLVAAQWWDDVTFTGCQLAWPALLRKLCRIDPSYCD